MHLLNNCSVCLFVSYFERMLPRQLSDCFPKFVFCEFINNDLALYFPIINCDSSTEKETTDDKGIPDVSKQGKQRKYDAEM